MGYEHKFKEGEERMKILQYILIGTCCLAWVAYAKAQTINPDDMLNNDNGTIEAPAPKVPESQPKLSKEWVTLSRGVLCNSIGMVREMLKTMRGQTTWAAAANQMQPGDPFNALIIVRNPETRSYSVILMSTDNNIACIVSTGIGLELLDNDQN
jgi:hypothetical protein